MNLRHKPAVLAISRQPLPTLDRSKYAPASGVSQSAYVLADAPGGKPEVILTASASEVILAVQAHGKLLAGGIRFGFEPDPVVAVAKELAGEEITSRYLRK